MKRIFLALVIFSSLTFGLTASPKKGMDHKGGKGKMTELNLSQDQQTRVESLNKEFKAKFDALRNDKSLDDTSRRTQIKTLREDRRSQFNAILTPDQQTKLQESKKNIGQKRARKQGDRQKRRGQFQSDLNLTDVQKTKMKASRKSFKEKMEVLKNDSSLSKEDKKSKMQELFSGHRSEVTSFLTPDQQAKMKERKGDKVKRSKKSKDGNKGRSKKDKSENKKG